MNDLVLVVTGKAARQGRVKFKTLLLSTTGQLSSFTGVDIDPRGGHTVWY